MVGLVSGVAGAHAACGKLAIRWGYWSCGFRVLTRRAFVIVKERMSLTVACTLRRHTLYV